MSTSDNTYLRVKRHNTLAKIPQRQTTGSAGYDLHSVEDIAINPRGYAIVDTGISIELPPNTYGRIAPRSGLAAKNQIDVGAGVIDSDYTGVVKVILFNHSDKRLVIKVGDRIAQLIIVRIETPFPVEVDELNKTEREEGGFGSTGIN